MALVVDEEVPAGALVAALESSRLVASARVFDVYRGEQLGAGKKSVAIAVRLQSPAATLTDAEIETIAGKIVAAVAKATGAVLRT